MGSEMCIRDRCEGMPPRAAAARRLARLSSDRLADERPDVDPTSTAQFSSVPERKSQPDCFVDEL